MRKDGLGPERSDEDLVRQAVEDRGPAGRAAAGALFERYHDRVYRWCRRFVRDPERALDLSQDVLLNAWRALGRFDARVPFACWLFVIARNRCFSALRPVSLVRDDDRDPDTLEGRASGPEDDLVEREGEERLLTMMRDALDPAEQDALYLRCFERLPVEEVTRRLALTNASGARAVLQSARRKLRAALGRSGTEVGP